MRLYLHTNVCLCICQRVDSVSGAGVPLPGPAHVALPSVANMRCAAPRPRPVLLGPARGGRGLTAGPGVAQAESDHIRLRGH